MLVGLLSCQLINKHMCIHGNMSGQWQPCWRCALFYLGLADWCAKHSHIVRPCWPGNFWYVLRFLLFGPPYKQIVSQPTHIALDMWEKTPFPTVVLCVAYHGWCVHESSGQQFVSKPVWQSLPNAVRYMRVEVPSSVSIAMTLYC